MSTDFQNFFVGTYSKKGPYVPNANGEGILCCSLNLDSGEIKKESVYTNTFNATYLGKDSERNLFAACDYFDKIGEIQAFKIKEENKLERLSVSSSKGQSTCHLCVDNKRKQVYAASYMDGKLSRHSFDGKSLEQSPQVLSFEGSGPYKERQEAAHIHQVEIHPNGKWLYACDLGSDAILQFRMPENNGELQLVRRISAPPGSGPRHLVFHPNKALAYLFCELDSNVLTYTIDENSGDMNLNDCISSLPEDFDGIPAGAAIKIHPSAKTLYVSNRNHHSISVFKVDENDGSLSLDSIFSSEGEEPRDFSVDPTGKWLLAANQNSDCIVPFRLDPQSGLPEGSKGPIFRCGTPVCILFQ